MHAHTPYQNCNSYVLLYRKRAQQKSSFGKYENVKNKTVVEEHVILLSPKHSYPLLQTFQIFTQKNKSSFKIVSHEYKYKLNAT